MSASYHAPLEEQLFLLERVIQWQQLLDYPAYDHLDEHIGRAVLEEGAKFCTEVIAPINIIGDQEGCKLENGRVSTPIVFREAYKKFTEAGWPGLDMPESAGGQGLPLSLQVAFAEMLNGACMSFGMLPTMLRAASALLLEHANSELLEKVVPKLVSGEWGATICITEAGAGSDVGRLKTQAVLQGDGSYILNGSKMFITYADHDLTEQKIHLVLARCPDAPKGTKGISLFVVPRLDFESGSTNGVAVSRVEEKMGLKASPTCVLDFENARGYRVGEENRGLACMFTMVNMMRLEVSIQGPAIGGAATHRAINYARERKQGGVASQQAVAIIEHPDVRRMLQAMQARTESIRALIFETAFNLDLARVQKDRDKSQRARKLAEFLLPVCKAAGSQTGFDVANQALQVFGGHGYIRENGIEQYVRDVRVAMIYEGANGIQALDLVTRKLLNDGGERYQIFLARVNHDIETLGNSVVCSEAAEQLCMSVGHLAEATELLFARQENDLRDIQASASDYLCLVALVGQGWMCMRMIDSINSTQESGGSKMLVYNYFLSHLLPETGLLLTRIRQGAKHIDDDSLSSYNG